MTDATKISIKDYLESQGIPTRKEGNRYFASSPFSHDSNWSLCIYPTNTYFDYANGHGGNIINLCSRMHGMSLSEAAKCLVNGIKHEKYQPTYKKEGTQQEHKSPFDYKKYINTNPEECEQIKAYASKRGITEGYFCGVFFTRGVDRIQKEHKNVWVRVPALAFLHVDKDLKPCGIKFRRIDNQSTRFSARGSLGFYILGIKKNLKDAGEAVVYVVESETSANSLYMYLANQQRNVIVLSRGGVSTVTTIQVLPEQLQSLSKKLIIDYDGNEELYQERLKLYKDLGAEPIKMILPKGEDINSLYCKNEMWKVESLLL